MSLIKRPVFYLLFCFAFACACSDGNADLLEGIDSDDSLEAEALNNTPPTYEEQAKEHEELEKKEYLETQSLNLEELKKQAKVYTFEDIKPIDKIFREVISTNNKVIWFKDFKNWKIEELDRKQKRSLTHLFHLYNKNLKTEGYYDKVYIDNDGKIFNVTLNQLKSITSKLKWSDLCFPTTSVSFFEITNYYPVEYIKQLNANQLRAFQGCLRQEQLLALTNEQIIGSKNFSASGRVVPFSSERLNSMGEGLEEMPCWAFIKLKSEQVAGLTPEQIGRARKKSHWHGNFEWCWSPEQMAWLTPEQISGLLIDDRTKLHREHIEVLSKDQIKGFSKKQIESIPRKFIKLFSPAQIFAIIENNTNGYFVDRVFDFQMEGPGIFDELLDDLPSFHAELATHIYSLLPEQFSSLRLEQAQSLPFEAPFEFSPEQIANFPYFVKMLNFSDNEWEHFREKNEIKEYIPVETYAVLEAIGKIEANLKNIHGTLNHAKLLNRKQVQAIPPDQIPDFPPAGLNTLYERNFDQEEYDVFAHEKITPPYMQGFDKYDREENKKYIVEPGKEYEGQYEIPLTPEQFANMTLEQFKFIFDRYSPYDLDYLTDEYLNTLSLEKVNLLLSFVEDETQPNAVYTSENTKRLLDRKTKLQTP